MLVDQLFVFFVGLAILGLLFAFFTIENERYRRNVGSILIAIIVGLSVYAITPPKETLKKGIDIAGGSSYTLRVQPTEDEETGEMVPVTATAVEEAIKTIEGRINEGSTKDMLIQRQGDDQIILEMPGASEAEATEIRKKLETVSKLELRMVHPQSRSLVQSLEIGDKRSVRGYKVYKQVYTDDEGVKTEGKILLSKRIIIDGSNVKYAFPDLSRRGVVAIELTKEGGKKMRNATDPTKITHEVSSMATVLDNICINTATVRSRLSERFEVSGLGNKEEVEELSAALLNPLKNPLIVEEAREVSARLGQATVKQGVYAGILGLTLTLLFILAYYRFAGIIALIALLLNILILFGIMAMFGFTFTLPGIAGIILTIGVAVDANVLIYERLREEINAGKSLPFAVRTAFEKAFSAIFDANITTLITALILFWKASGTVKGFAITLTIGILASMLSALIITRVLFWWGIDLKLIKKLNFMNLFTKKAYNFLDKRKVFFPLSILLIIGSLAFIGIKQDRAFGIDFVGGNIVSFQMGNIEAPASAEVEKALVSNLELSKSPVVQNETSQVTGKLLTIRCADQDVTNVVKQCRESFPVLKGVELSQDKVSATLGGEFLRNSAMALGLGLLAILVYITIRFEFSFALGAFFALFHDVIIVLGIIILLGGELSLIHVGAILTIAGYSINDTIVVFDRIRENLKTKRGKVKDIMNDAISTTLSRTVLTSVTTLVSVILLFFLGGPALKDFALAIIVGVLVGTYSSIFVASPIVYLWSKFRGTNLRRELLDADLSQQVSPGKG